MTKRLSLLILCISICAFCFAQEEQNISADRPGMSTGTDVMPLHKVQWETGVAFDWEHRGGAKQETFTINNTLFRYGLTPSMDKSLLAEGIVAIIKEIGNMQLQTI